MNAPCTVRHFDNSRGSILHWRPLRSRYSTAQNTSYKSTVVGFVRFLMLCSDGRPFEIASRPPAGGSGCGVRPCVIDRKIATPSALPGFT